MIDLRFFVFMIIVLGKNHNVNSVSAKVLPGKTDLPIYLRALERIIHSAGTPKNKIDGNFGLGLFLANVNLKSALKRKNESMPGTVITQIQNILEKNKIMMSFFKYRRAHTHDNYEMTYLFIDEDSWAERLPKFLVVGATEDMSKEYLLEEYSQWSSYEKRLLDFENSVPSPAQSDACMASLAVNQMNRGPLAYKCTTALECLNFVENGSDFGYAIVHRVLFLLVARYSRGCYAFSPQLDEAFVDKLCANIYDEANYIVLNKFQSPDLLMEQISTCSLAGHAEFLQRKWFNRLLKQQTPYGCFSTYLNTVYNRMSQPSKNANGCNGHVSGVAAAALSASARYIVETYF